MVRWSIMYLSDDTVILGGSEGGSVCVCVWWGERNKSESAKSSAENEHEKSFSIRLSLLEFFSTINSYN